MNAFTAEHIGGMLLVQLFGRQRKDNDEFRGYSGSLLDANMEVVHSFALFEPVVAMVSAITDRPSSSSSAAASSSTSRCRSARFVAFLQLVAMYYNPVREIADRFNILQSAMAALERIFTLLDQPEGVQDDADALDLPEKIAGAVEFEHVSFAYTAGHVGAARTSASRSRPASASRSSAQPAPARRA